jgi:predicted transcriptional regulator
MSKKEWGSDPLAVDAATAFASIEASSTVRLISTFEPNLIFCQEDDLVHNVCECDRYRPFDYLPVKRGDRIIGLLSLEKVRSNSDAGFDPVFKHMKQIDDTVLVSSDVGILSFVEHAEEHPCRLVVSGMKLDGIVTLSDLQKLPVRPSIFFLITHLELLMATTLRSTFNDDGDWLKLLSQNRQDRIEEKWNALKMGNMDIDRILATDFCDKRDLILKLGLFHSGITRKQATKQLKSIERLRDHVAHAGDIASTQDKALQAVSSVKAARQWITYLTALLADRGHSPPKA